MEIAENSKLWTRCFKIELLSMTWRDLGSYSKLAPTGSSSLWVIQFWFVIFISTIHFPSLTNTSQTKNICILRPEQYPQGYIRTTRAVGECGSSVAMVEVVAESNGVVRVYHLVCRLSSWLSWQDTQIILQKGSTTGLINHSGRLGWKSNYCCCVRVAELSHQ